MNWTEILQWSQKGFIACCALVVQLTLALAVSQEMKQVRARPADPGHGVHAPAPAKQR